MKPKRLKAARVGLVVIAGALAMIFIASPLPAQKPDPLFPPDRSEDYPRQVWSRVFPANLTGAAVARKTGAVAASTADKVYYFTDSATPVWTAGEDWKSVDSLGINGSGDRVLFQTDVKPRKSTEAMNYTLRLYDGEGAEMWAKPNPGRYQRAMLSPSGKHILIGEHWHPGVSLYDDNLNLLWKKSIQFWSLAFDPLERFLFDGEGGQLYSIEGERVWDFGAGARILSVSDNAEFVLTRYYKTARGGQRIFLTSRTALKRVELEGTGGAVSPDGSLTAYVNLDKKLVIYRTRELLESGPGDLPPLFETGFIRPWVIQLARDNRSLFVMGEESARRSVMMLVDLARMKTAWKKSVAADLRVALPDENNRRVVLQTSDKTLVKFECYPGD